MVNCCRWFAQDRTQLKDRLFGLLGEVSLSGNDGWEE